MPPQLLLLLLLLGLALSDHGSQIRLSMPWTSSVSEQDNNSLSHLSIPWASSLSTQGCWDEVPVNRTVRSASDDPFWKVGLQPLLLNDGLLGELQDVKLLWRPSKTTTACVARIGRFLVLLSYQPTSKQWIVSATTEVFGEGARLSPRKYPWIISGDIIVIQANHAMLFYRPSSDLSQLEQVADPEGIFSNYLIMSDENIVAFGHFYPEPNDIGILSKLSGLVEFRKVDLSVSDEALLRLPNVDLDEFWLSNSTLYFIDNISKKSEPDSFILLNDNVLRVYGFDSSYKLKLKLTSAVPLSCGNGNVMVRFADLTGQLFKDLLIFNDLGLFVYQFNETSREYVLLDVDTAFSPNHGWLNSNAFTILPLHNRDVLTFSASHGFSLLTFDVATSSWQLVGDSTQIHFSSSISSVRDENGPIIFSQSDSGEIHWGRPKLSKDKPPPLILDYSEKTEEVDFFNLAPGERATGKVEQIAVGAMQTKPVLRWAERWPDHFGKEAVNMANGGVAWELPLVNVTVSPVLAVSVTAVYDSQRDAASPLGTGWLINTMQDFIVVDYQQSIFPDDHKYYISREGVAAAQPLIYSGNIGSIATYTISNDSAHKVEWDKDANTWRYSYLQLQRTYGSCMGHDAVHWSLGWPFWRGVGTDLNSLEPTPAAWYLCQTRDTTSERAVRYQYRSDWNIFANGKKIATSMRLVSITDDNGLTISLKYGKKDSDEYIYNDPYDDVNKVYRFPTPLVNEYFLTDILTETPLYQQHLSFHYSKPFAGHRVFTGMSQIAREGREQVVDFEYGKVGEFVVLTKYTAQNKLTADYEYVAFTNPVLYAPVTDFPMYSDLKMAQANDYVVTAHANYLDSRELYVKVMNKMGTHTVDEFTVTASADVEAFDVRALNQHLIFILLTQKDTEVLKYAKEDKGWSRTADVTRLRGKATISTNEGIVAYLEENNTGVNVLEWDWNRRSWNHTSISSPALSGCMIQSSSIACYRDNQLWLFFKKRNWQQKVIPLDGWTFRECQILKHFNYTTKVTNDLCTFMKQRTFQFERNQIFSASIVKEGDIMKLRGLFLLLDKNFDIANKQEIELFSENVMQMQKDIELPPKDGKKGKFHIRHTTSNGKIIMEVYDVSGELFGSPSSDQKRQMLEEYNTDETWHNSSLVEWSNYTALLGSPGIQLSDSTVYQPTGSSWRKVSSHQNQFIRLGRSFILKSSNDKHFELVKKLPSGAENVQESFTLTKPGQMLIRYPEYIAYHSAENVVNVITFADGDTIAARLEFEKEQILFSSGFQSLMTRANTSSDSMKFSTAQYYRVRPISSLQLKLAPPTVALLRTRDGKDTRLTGYKRSFRTDPRTLILTQIVSVVPAAEKSLSGWVEQHVHFDMLKQNSTSKAIVFDSEGNKLKMPDQKKPTLDDNGRDKVGQNGMLWDKSGEWEISNFFPYSLADDEADYFGFEDYEDPMSWKFNPADVVRNKFSFTGKNFLSLKDGSFLRRDFTPEYQDGTFIASCWLRAPKLSAPGKPSPLFSAQITNSNGTDIIKLLAETKRVQGSWQYLEIRLDMSLIYEIYKAYVREHSEQINILPAPELVKFQMKLKIVADDGGRVDVDHVRFSGLAHEFSATVYDVALAAVTERISSNGLVTRTRYNHLGQRVVSMAETGQVEEIITSSHTGKLISQPTSLRSRQIIIKPLRGFTENFDELSFLRRWKVDSAANWKVAPYQLVHKSSEWHSIETEAKLVTTQSVVLRLDYILADQPCTIRINWRGSSIKLAREDGNGILSLDGGNSKQRVPLVAELIVFINSERTLVLVDGVEAIDQTRNNERNSALKLSVVGDVTLQNLVLAEEPVIEVQFQNGWGDVVQVVQLEDGNLVRVTETLYDQLGRGAISTKTTRLSRHAGQPLLAIEDDFIENRRDVWTVGRMKGLVDKLNPDDGGYPYTKTEYYANPLNEKKADGLPGAEFAANGKFVKRFKTNSNIDFLTNLFPPKLGYRQETIVEPNESVHVTVFDGANNKVAKYTSVPGFDDILSTYEYNSKNQMIKILPPLYHDKANTSSRFEPWQSGDNHLTEKEKALQSAFGTFFAFDKDGNMVMKKTPDAGIIEYLYNSRGYMRFSFTMNTTCNMTEGLTYYDYDVQGQMTESGEITTPMSRDQLLDNLVEKYIPGKQAFQKIEFADSHPDPDLRGRFQIIVTNTGNGTVLDRVVYNADKEVTAKSTIPLADSSSLEAPTTLNKTYVGKKLYIIDYPLEVDGKALKLVHSYNGAGQLTGLGVSNNPTLFAAFSYHGSGTLATEQYNVPDGKFTRSFSYNSPGYLQAIRDPFLEQSTTYTSGGYGQAGFGDGIIMSTTFKPHWYNKADSRQFSVDPSKLKGDKQYAAMCLDFLRERGFIDSRNVPIKNFDPNQVIDFPLLCRAEVGYSLAMALARAHPAETYGHCYAYGNHKELVKAKYFSTPSSGCPQPLNPFTFSAEIASISPNESVDIFEALAKANFLVTDRMRYDPKFTTGTPGISLVRVDDISNVLDVLAEKDVTIIKYLYSIERLIKHAIIRQEYISLQKFSQYILSWDREPGIRIVPTTDKTTIQTLYKALMERKLLPTSDNELLYLDNKFISSLEKYKSYIPQIARVLLDKFQNTILSSAFDVMSFEIDPNGNHRKFSVGYERYTLDYFQASNKIEQVELRSIFTDNEPVKFAMRHDSRGNVIQAMHKRIIDISYTGAANRVQSITLQDGRRLFFFYDGKGERALKQVTDSTGKVIHEKHYLRDDEGRVLVERSICYNTAPIAPDTILTAYIYGPRGLLGFIRKDEFYSVTTDHIGSVRLVAHRGRVVAAYDYLPYGELMRSYGADSALGLDYRYTGQELDEETGLYNYHARLYDPSIGRFYQPDPQAQYFSPYKYAGNSPVALFDPDGEFAFLIAAIVLAVVGAYVGGAAANGTWNIFKWDWNAKTILGALMGAITGFFLPFGIGASFAVLAPIMGAGLAATTVTVLGIGGAYMMGAMTQGLNPLQWKWSEPEIWDAMFSGFATGSGIVGSIGGIHKLGASAAKWASSTKRFAIIQKFARFAKPAVIGTSYLSGGAMAYVSAMAANNNNPAFWQWDWSNINTWGGLINGFDGGSGLPENVISIGTLLRKGVKNGKNLLTAFKTMSPTNARGIFKALTNRKSALFKTAAAALMAWAMGSEANGGDFFNWDWSKFGTYQAIMNGAFTGKGIVHEFSTRATKKQMKKFVTSFKISAKNIFNASRNMISRVLRSVFHFHIKIGLRGIEMMRRFASIAGSNTVRYWDHLLRRKGIDLLVEVGNLRGRRDRERLADIELKSLHSFHDDLVKAERDSNRVFVDEDVSFMACSKRLRRRKRTGGDGSISTCGLRVSLPVVEASEEFIGKPRNRGLIEAVLKKSPKAHSTNDVLFYPMYVLGGVDVHLQTGTHTVTDAFCSRTVDEQKIKFKVQGKDKHVTLRTVDQTIILVHAPDVNNNGKQKVTIKKFITDENGVTLKGHENDWKANKIVDVKKLVSLLHDKKVDLRNVEIAAELTVLHIKRAEGSKSAERNIEVSEGKILGIHELANIDQSDYNPFYSGKQGVELEQHVKDFLELNDGNPNNLDAQKASIESITEVLLSRYQEWREKMGMAYDVKKPKEAEFHAFLYGAIEMNLKKHNADVIVESRIGKGDLDMVLFFRKDPSNTVDNWQSRPIIFELKSIKNPKIREKNFDGEELINKPGNSKVQEKIKTEELLTESFPGLKFQTHSERKRDQVNDVWEPWGNQPWEVSHYSAVYKADARTATEQISREGYHCNLPLKTHADKAIIVGVNSWVPVTSKDSPADVSRKIKENIQMGELAVPTYDGLVDHLIKSTDMDSKAILQEVAKQYYSYSPYSNKKGTEQSEDPNSFVPKEDASTYMSRFALGEVLGRAQESYVQRSSKDGKDMIALFKGEGDRWVLLQVSQSEQNMRSAVVVPDHVPPKNIRSLRIQTVKDLAEKANQPIHLDNSNPMEPLHWHDRKAQDEGLVNNFEPMKRIDASAMLTKPLEDSPFQDILHNFERELQKITHTFTDEGDVQAILQGALLGNKDLFARQGMELRVHPESSLTASGYIDLLMTVTNKNVSPPRDAYVNVIEMKFVKPPINPPTKKQKPDPRMQQELKGAVKQVMAYFEQHHLEAVTSRDKVESTAVVVNQKGEIYYAIVDVTLSPSLEFKLRVTNKDANGDALIVIINEKNKKMIESIGKLKRNRRDLSYEECVSGSLKCGSQTVPEVDGHQQAAVSVNEARMLSRQRVLEGYSKGWSSSSASRAQLWPVQFIKSLFSTLSIIWNSTPTVGSKREINKLLKQQKFEKIEPGQHFSVLDMGDAWLAETNMQGNLLWVTILLNKLTGVKPYNADPHSLRSPEQMQLLRLLSSEMVYDVQDRVCQAAGACGISPTVRKALHQTDMARLSEMVYRKLINSDIDHIGPLLFSQLVANNRDEIAVMSTSKQADKWASLVLGPNFSD